MCEHLKSEQVLSRVMLNTPSSRTLFLCTVPPNTLFIICRAQGPHEKPPQSLHHSTPHQDWQHLITFLLLSKEFPSEWIPALCQACSPLLGECHTHREQNPTGRDLHNNLIFHNVQLLPSGTLQTSWVPKATAKNWIYSLSSVLWLTLGKKKDAQAEIIHLKQPLSPWKFVLLSWDLPDPCRITSDAQVRKGYFLFGEGELSTVRNC